MKNFPKKQSSGRLPGMTLMEVVIAIGVVGFVVPIILTATASTASSRLSAEADTRSAWLAKDVRRELLSEWAGLDSVITTEVDFPVFASESDPLVFAYDSDGNFLEEGDASDINSPSKIQKAAYLVTIYGEAHTPPNMTVVPPAEAPLSLLRIRVLHPAKSAPVNRSDLRYNVLTYRQGSL